MKKKKSTRGKACSLVSNKDRIWKCAKPARWNISPFQLLFLCERTNPEPELLGIPPFKLLNESRSPWVPFFLYYRMYTLYNSECWYIPLHWTDWWNKVQTPTLLSGWQSTAEVCSILQTIMSHLKETFWSKWKYKTNFSSLMTEQSFPASQPHIFTAY